MPASRGSVGLRRDRDAVGEVGEILVVADLVEVEVAAEAVRHLLLVAPHQRVARRVVCRSSGSTCASASPAFCQPSLPSR
jgi:hypothetical protein